MRVGIFGGTFNPIHLGHLRAAEEIRERFDLKRIIFIAAATPPHKAVEGGVSGERRTEMVRLAISGNTRFSVSDIELKRPGKSYSIGTIQFFRQRYGTNLDLFFILGMDAFMQFHAWHRWQDIPGLAHLVVAGRPGSEMHFENSELKDCFNECKTGSVESLHKTKHGHIYICDVTQLDISATTIRSRVATGESLEGLVAEPVAHYIQQHGLYQ